MINYTTQNLLHKFYYKKLIKSCNSTIEINLKSEII